MDRGDRTLSLGGNSTIKTIIHKQEMKLVRDYLNCFETELKGVSELKEDLTPNPRFIILKAKIEFARKLLGKR